MKILSFGFPCYEISTAGDAQHLVDFLSTRSFIQIAQDDAD